MAQKMSVQEILAAARAQKAGGAPPSPPPPQAETPAESAPQAPAAPRAAQAAPAPQPAAGGKISVQEMIAAARAQKAGGAPAAAPAAKAPTAKPAAEKPAAAAAVTKAEVKPAATGPKDTASILAAARKVSKPGPLSKSEAAAKTAPVAAPEKKKLEVPPMPAKPDFARPRPAPAAEQQTRRGFMAAVSSAVGFAFGTSLAIGFSSLVITHLMWLLGLARFMFPNILIEPPTRFKVGFPDAYAPGQVETKYIPQFGVWIVRFEYEGQPILFALKSVCTHLGCTPNWLEAEQKFKCPCHGSGFYKDGINFEGPAPRPLERYAISLEDGQIVVDKSRTFQQELGQWNDPASFVPV